MTDGMADPNTCGFSGRRRALVLLGSLGGVGWGLWAKAADPAAKAIVLAVQKARDEVRRKAAVT
jgi:hypothetical protein